MRGTRAQTETIGVLLLTGVVIVSTVVVGAMLFARQSQQIQAHQTPTEFETEINGTSLTLTHEGGREIPLADLDLLLRQGDSESRYDLNDSSDRSSDTLNGNDDFESGESVTVSHSFRGDVRVLLVETVDNGVVLYDETKPVEGSTSAVAPTIQKFDLNDTSSGGDASYDVTWNASDDQGDITEVNVELVDQSSGVVQDSATTSFSEVATTGENTDTLTNASGGGEVYEIRLTVTDTAGNTASETTADTADSNIGLRDPVIEKYDVTDVSTGSQVSYDYTYNASDPDDDLVEVTLELINTTSSAVVDNVTDSYAQVATTGIQTGTLTDSTTGKNDNQEFNITLTVSDLEGNDVVSTVTDIADGGGGGGGGNNPPTIDQFDVSDTSTNCNGGGKKSPSYTIDWSVSDADSDLGSVTLEVTRTGKSNPDDTQTYSDSALAEDSDSRSNVELTPNNCNKKYDVNITVDDDSGNTVTETWTDTTDGSGSN